MRPVSTRPALDEVVVAVTTAARSRRLRHLTVSRGRPDNRPFSTGVVRVASRGPSRTAGRRAGPAHVPIRRRPDRRRAGAARAAQAAVPRCGDVLAEERQPAALTKRSAPRPRDRERLLGYAFWTTELEPLERGYDGPIKMLVGMDTKGVLAGVIVTEHHEPYGNFSIEPPEFAAQFKGKNIRDPFKVGADIDAVVARHDQRDERERAPIRNSARRDRARSCSRPPAPPSDAVTAAARLLLSSALCALPRAAAPVLARKRRRLPARSQRGSSRRRRLELRRRATTPRRRSSISPRARRSTSRCSPRSRRWRWSASSARACALKYVTLVASVALLGFSKSQLISIVNIFGCSTGTCRSSSTASRWYLFAGVHRRLDGAVGTPLLRPHLRVRRADAADGSRSCRHAARRLPPRARAARELDQVRRARRRGRLFPRRRATSPIYRYVEPFWMFRPARHDRDVDRRSAVLLVATVFVRNLYCRFLCPVGACARPAVEPDRVPDQALVGVQHLQDLREDLRVGRDPRTEDHQERVRPLRRLRAALHGPAEVPALAARGETQGARDSVAGVHRARSTGACDRGQPSRRDEAPGPLGAGTR